MIAIILVYPARKCTLVWQWTLNSCTCRILPQRFPRPTQEIRPTCNILNIIPSWNNTSLDIELELFD